MHAVILPPGRQESKREGSGSPQPGVHSALALPLGCAETGVAGAFPAIPTPPQAARLWRGRPGGSRELEPRGTAADLFAVSGPAPPPPASRGAPDPHSTHRSEGVGMQRPDPSSPNFPKASLPPALLQLKKSN